MAENEIAPVEENALVLSPVLESAAEPVVLSIADERYMKRMYNLAKFYAKSLIVPKEYRGDVAACFDACDMAARLGMPVMQVFQNLFFVNGRPSWSGQMCIALLNASKKYDGGEFVEVGERDTDSWGIHWQARRVADGKVIKGVTVTIKMVKDEGWLKNTKWTSMPEMMLKYRAAAYFARTECPEVLAGLQMRDELDDIMPQKTVIKLGVSHGDES